MRSFTIRVLVAILMVTAALSASATETLFISTSNIDPGPAPAGTSSTITINSLGSHTLYIWATDGTEVTPPVTSPPISPSWPAQIPPSTAYFSYDLGVTGPQASAISLTAAKIENPVILDQNGNTLQGNTDWNGATPPATVTRWGGASSFIVGINPQATASAITQLNATALPLATPSTGTPNGVDTHIHTGLSISPNDLYSGPQPGYNAAAHAFLVGEVSFTVNSFNSPGDTVLRILPSSLNTTPGSAIGYSYAAGSLAQGYTPVYVDLASNFNATLNVVYAKGDWNHDGQATVADISVMSAAMRDLDAYDSSNSLTPTQLALIGDFDSSDTVDNKDMQGLIDLVATGGGSPGAPGLTTVPEPATWSLLAIGAIALASVGRRRLAG
jgi:hypothetical protein